MAHQRTWASAAAVVLGAAIVLGVLSLRRSLAPDSTDLNPRHQVARNHTSLRGAGSTPAADAVGGRSTAALRVVFPSRQAAKEAKLKITVRAATGGELVEQLLIQTDATRAKVLTSRREAQASAAMDDEHIADILVPAMEQGQYRVWAETLPGSPMLLTARPKQLSMPSNKVLSMELAASAAGIGYLNVIVRRPDSTPVSQATIRVTNDAGFERSVSTANARHGGLISVPAGVYEVSVTSYPGHDVLGLPDPQHVAVSGRETRDVEFMLNAAARVHVLAESPSRERIPFDLSLWARSEAGEWMAMPVGPLFTYSRFEWIGRLPIGKYLAQISPKFYFEVTRREFEVVDGAEVVRVAVELAEARHSPIRILVRSSNGKPQDGVGLSVNSVTDRIETFTASYVSADDQGMAVTAPLPPGRYAVWFWDLELMCFLRHDGTDLVHTVNLNDLACEPAGDCAVLRGRVTLKGKAEASTRYLVLVDQFAEALLFTHRVIGVDPSLEYELRAVLPGRYYLWTPWVANHRHPTLEYYSEPFELHSGQELKVDVELTPFASTERSK